MARKDPSEWSDAYRRRIERAQAKGLTRQQARGHKAHEHVIRREREKRVAEMVGSLTSDQRQNVRRFARAQAARSPLADTDQVVADLLQWTQANGYDRFLSVRDAQRGLQRQFRGDVKRKRYVSKGMAVIDLYGLDYPDADPVWFFYH